MTSLAPSTFATHWILPAWWIRAYETAVLAEADGDSAMSQALKGGLAPALSAFEMNALAVVLACMQEQILASSDGGRRLSVATEEHLKHAGTASRPKRLQFEKVIQNLCGIRVLADGGDGSPRAHRLFSHDVWRVGGDGGSTDQAAVTCELTPSRLGFELVLGYGDAHLDLVRYAQGEPTAAKVLGSQAPLALTRSLWLDLAGVDQLLLLRLERAMQWQFRWLQLEGVFGVPLAELFRGLRLDRADTAPGEGPKENELSGRLRMLARLGRKLSAHGFLASPQADCYLAVAEAEEKELSLVWQLTRERLGSEAASAFRRGVAATTRAHRYGDFTEPLHRLFLGPSPGPEALARSRALWERLGSIDEAPVDIGGLEHAPSMMISPQALFYELKLRQEGAATRFQVPPALLEGPLGRLVARGGESEEAQRYLAFCRLLDESPELLRALRDLPFATLTSEASQRDPALGGYLASLLAPAASELLPVTRAGAETLPAVAATKDGVGADGLFASDGSAVTRRKAQVSGALASRMLRIASDELTRLRDAHPERYADLKRTFLGSLDDVDRRLILDIQKRMQATVFEEHLRQRLVRFMVENPSSWRSAELPRREAGERPW